MHSGRNNIRVSVPDGVGQQWPSASTALGTPAQKSLSSATQAALDRIVAAFERGCYGARRPSVHSTDFSSPIPAPKLPLLQHATTAADIAIVPPCVPQKPIAPNLPVDYPEKQGPSLALSLLTDSASSFLHVGQGRNPSVLLDFVDI